MRAAIVHYHLRRGGVTRVICGAVSAVETHGGQAVVLAGEDPTDPDVAPQCVAVMPELGYGQATSLAPDLLAQRAMEIVVERLGGRPDVWHFHNHALGKNAVLTATALGLVRRGEPVLLQIHDFAEDGRPDNYCWLCAQFGAGSDLGDVLYPQAGNVHYAVLNCRDRDFLQRAGLDAARCHLLPNPAGLGDGRAPASADVSDNVLCPGRRLLLYPSRAIRRKNIGEVMFWAALAEENDLYGVTLAPENPAARPVYERWCAFAARHKLPVEFELGVRWNGPFAGLLAQAAAALTTSVAEGFGLAFLEPWLAGRPLVGRALPELCPDLVAEGVDLSGLYDRLLVPIQWVGSSRFRHRVRENLAAAWGAYGRPLGGELVEPAIAAACCGERVDFGRLDEEMQRMVVRRVACSPAARSECAPQGLGDLCREAGRVPGNRDVVRRRYSLARFGQGLTEVYGAVAGSPATPAQPLATQTLLDCFLTPERFFLLRT